MLSSITKEKENRVMEILISSIKPLELFTGKILGLGLVGLLQMVVWMSSALLLLRLGGNTLNLPQNLQLPPQIIVWGIVFFILGYLLYATIMASIGILVPNLKEASQATYVVIIPFLIPLMLVGAIIEKPNGILSTVLSLIPLTAPNTMMTRLAAATVPLWQLLVSIALMLVTIILLIRAVSSMFRAQHLLTGKKFSLGLFIKLLMGQEVSSVEESQ
jgi:ABC-2 type transport system permease protein